jgi:GDP/UDP-N,N'-diacetylbacillosamine 2-epimerase (hydrolysing)
MLKICIVTGTRAEYGLLYWLMREMKSDRNIELQIVVTGMHLSEEFGSTYREIENDGFIISKKVYIDLSSDNSYGVSKSMGLGIIGFAQEFKNLTPDLVVVLGDRFETFSAVIAAMVAKIPIAHLHGGETTEGAFDEAIRHSITKMSHLHFVATKAYKKRVIQLGEHSNKVFIVGGLGIENINRLNLLSRNNFENKINFKLGKKNILITFHPVTLESNTSKVQFQELLNAIDELDNTNFIFTKANSDTDGKIINHMIDEYVSKKNNVISFKSMGQLNYLSALKFMDVVLGNSSSGILEAPSFKITTINIGDRQKGRIKANSIIDCDANFQSIRAALTKAYSNDFQNSLDSVKNPYDFGNTSKKILKVIKNVDLTNLLKKSFNDIDDSILSREKK